MRAYASAARSRGTVSIIGRTFWNTLNVRVSSISMAVPARVPSSERAPNMSWAGFTWIGSGDAPATISRPRGASRRARELAFQRSSGCPEPRLRLLCTLPLCPLHPWFRFHGSLDVQKNSLVDERGLVLSDDLHLSFSRDLCSLRLRLDGDHVRARADLGARWDGRDEAQLVRAVVNEAAEAGDIPIARNLEGGEGGKGEEAARGAPLAGTLPPP